jgi:PST family polysaccharide transporter
MLGDYSSFVRIFLSGGFCICIYLALVIGLFRLTEPIKVALSIMQDLLRSPSLPSTR